MSRIPASRQIHIVESQLCDRQVRIGRIVVLLPKVFGKVAFRGNHPKRALEGDLSPAAFDYFGRRARVEPDGDVEFVTVGIAHDEAVLDTIRRERIVDVAAAHDAETVFRQVLNWFGPGGVKIRYELLIQGHQLLDLHEQLQR